MRIKVTDFKTDLDELVQETMAMAKSVHVEPPGSKRDVLNFKAHQGRLARERAEFAASVPKNILGRS